MKIYADIGGTFARFVRHENGTWQDSKKYRAADFPTLEDALATYCEEHTFKNTGAIAIATAAYPDEKNNWRFVNQNKWVISAASLKKAGWTRTTIMNDFEAATWGLLNHTAEDFKTLHTGTPSNRPQCLTGPGTGLGLGYLIHTAHGPHIQRTHGGHMIASPATEEQWLVIKTIHRQANTPRPVIFENLLSGPGLVNIHNAYSLICGTQTRIEKPEDILGTLNTRAGQNTIRLFNEFLGLHCRSAIITGHAYGGLTLSGGVLKRLDAQDLFDYAAFRQTFISAGVDSVTHDLENTPIHLFTGQHLAMKGLHICEAQT